jgi:hypothetical protein
MTINTASAGIIVDVQNATPGVWKGPRNAVCHLTQGFTSTPIGTWRADDAFSLTGHVKVTPGQDDTLLTLNKWQFGFIQFVRLNFLGFFYAGRTKQEGSISILCHIKPALPRAVWLDSDDKYSPWTRKEPRFQFVAPEIKSETGDHPAATAGWELPNSNTNVTNFLFHIVDSRDFWSVFTAIDPSGATHHLAHFHWSVRYDVLFRWRGGNPDVRETQSSFDPHENIKGRPKDPDLQALLTNPVGLQYNDIIKQAIQQSMTSGQTPNRHDNPQWFVNVPNDFFQ